MQSEVIIEEDVVESVSAPAPAPAPASAPAPVASDSGVVADGSENGGGDAETGLGDGHSVAEDPENVELGAGWP